VKENSRHWDTALVAGGVLIAGITYRTYRGIDFPSGTLTKVRLTPNQAQSIVTATTDDLHSNPEDFNAWSQLAIAYFNLGPSSYADGLNALEKARALGATSESLFYYAGIMYENLGLPDYAVNEFSKFLRHYPDDEEIQMHLANLFVLQKRYDDAYKLYTALAKRSSQNPALLLNLAVVCKEKGDFEGALNAFSKLHQLVKELPEGGLFQEGEVWRLKGSDDQAISFYQQEISLHPSSLPAFVALEAAQRRHGLLKEARETRKKITALKNK
jgi:tetratricopeptide (TPR) repeat protein